MIVNWARREEATRSCTASAGRRMTNHSTAFYVLQYCLKLNVWMFVNTPFHQLSNRDVFSPPGFTSAATAARTGTTGAAWASCRARPITSICTCARSVSRRKTPWQSSRRSQTKTMRGWKEYYARYRYGTYFRRPLLTCFTIYNIMAEERGAGRF